METENTEQTAVNEAKKTKGRPKGSNSFVVTNLSELKSLIEDENMDISVSKIWLNKMLSKPVQKVAPTIVEENGQKEVYF